MNDYANTFKMWDKHALAYKTKFMDVDLYNDTYDLFCDLIKNPNAELFEIGCGPGNITKYILSKCPDLKIDGIDVAPNMIALAQENNPQAQFKVMDCRYIHTISKKYDAVLCGFCMPYICKDDCEKLIANSFNLLNAQGLFYFSAIEGDYTQSGFELSSNGQDGMHVYFYSEHFFLETLSKNGFTCLTVKRKRYSKADKTPETHLIIIAQKKI